MVALLRLGVATSSVLRSGRSQDSATASGRRSVCPLTDRLVCWVPRVSQASRSPSIQIKTSITVRIARSASCLSVRLSVCLSSLCLSVCLLVCPSAIVTSYLSDFCLMRALWLCWQHDGGPNTPSWEVRSMFPSCRAAGRPGRGRRLTVVGCGAGVGIAAMAAEVI
jgi:hypothetical protein